ncbi:MAG TPA: hypothetical protein DDY13_12605 [Cytophagales bacterium]|jgi:hypothetical protein|nr:hypothetical protein [Cytophagales bacterium]
MVSEFKTRPQNKFEVGDVVYEICRPHPLMIIARISGFLCYCYILENKNHVMAYMERDLKKAKTVIDLSKTSISSHN